MVFPVSTTIWKNAASVVAAIGLVASIAAPSALASATKCEDFGPVKNACLIVEGDQTIVSRVSVSADSVSELGWLEMEVGGRIDAGRGLVFYQRAERWFQAAPAFYYEPKIPMRKRSAPVCGLGSRFPIPLADPITPVMCGNWWYPYSSGMYIVLSPLWHRRTGGTVRGPSLLVEVNGGVLDFP
ncbi:MAG: hypothetical protein V9E83_14810 [Baekduia sp.]